jgi:hypothetical protein
MFEKIGRLAEQAATRVGVSRRGFLGRLGQSALAVVGVLGGLAATAATARVGNGSYVCCKWHCHRPGSGTFSFCYPPGSTCSGVNNPCYAGWSLSQTTVNSCNQC